MIIVSIHYFCRRRAIDSLRLTCGTLPFAGGNGGLVPGFGGIGGVFTTGFGGCILTPYVILVHLMGTDPLILVLLP